MEDPGHKELLKKFEPILCFAGLEEKALSSASRYVDIIGEQFFPINLEAYLASCRLRRRSGGWGLFQLPSVDVTDEWYRVAKDIAEREGWDDFRLALGLALDEFGGDHFLRFLQAEDFSRSEEARETVKLDTPVFEGKERFMVAIPLLLAALGLAVGSYFAFSAGISWLGWLASVLAVFIVFGSTWVLFSLKVYLSVLMSLMVLTPIGLGVWAFVGGRPIWGWVGIWVSAWLAWALLFSLGVKGRLAEYRVQHLTLALQIPLIAVPCAFLGSRLGGLVCLVPAIVVWTLAFLSAAARDEGWRGLAKFGQAFLSFIMGRALLAPPEAAADKFKAMAEGQVGLRPRYTYYGRVVPKPSNPNEKALQYFYFYPYNDWARQGGANVHEGDWEAVFVYIEDKPGHGPKPLYVGLTQHHEGVTAEWHDRRVSKVEGNGQYHIVVFPAAGSHANFFEPSDPAEPRTSVYEARPLEGGVRLRPKPSPIEFPNGLGKTIGVDRHPDLPSQEPVEAWAEPVVLEPDDPRMGFCGLWGDHNGLLNFSGPSSARWERPKVPVLRLRRRRETSGKRQLCAEERDYWQQPYEWLECRLGKKKEDEERT